MASRYDDLTAPIRITGAQLVCAQCRCLMTNVTINALPMECPWCGHTLITQGEPFIDGEFEENDHASDCTCGSCMDAAYEVGR